MVPGVIARVRQLLLPAIPYRVVGPDELGIAICAGRRGVLVGVRLCPWHLAYDLTCLRRASSVRLNNYLTLVGFSAFPPSTLVLTDSSLDMSQLSCTTTTASLCSTR